MENIYKMKKPLASVIVVVVNGERYLASALHSIFQQDYRPFETIVVDGGSVDDTAAIAKSFSAIQYIRQKSCGLADARNTGINAARGEFIAFLDHDDYYTPDKLNVQVDYLIINPEIQYVNAMVKFFLEPGFSIRPGFKKEVFDKEQVGLTPGTLVARKSLFDQIGLFKTEFAIGCDVDWFARAKDYNIPTAVIPRVLLHKRIHDKNLSFNVKLNKKELFAIIRQSLERQRCLRAGNYYDK